MMKSTLSWNSTRRKGALGAISTGVWLFATSFNAFSAVIASYNAGSEGSPAEAPTPADAGWVAGSPTADQANFASVGVSPDGTSGWNAWRMLDNSTVANQFVTWNYGFTSEQHLAAANNGWNLSTLIRVADPVAGNAGGNSIVLLYGNGGTQRFIAFYDITPTNTLLITLAGSPNLTFNIPDTTVATGYNLHEMEFSPVTKRVTYRFNGTALTTNYAGTTGNFNGVQWGSGSTGGRGDSYWNYVSFNLFDPPPPPMVVQEPESATKAVGESVTFSPVFTNIVLGYQWYWDGSPIEGATNASYTIPFVTTLDAGDYVCRATNNSGYIDTTPATLTVLPDTQAPAVVSIVASVFAPRLRVRFSEPVTAESAEAVFNYSILGDNFTIEAARMVDRFTVDLTVTPAFVPGTTHTLLTSYIIDTANNASGQEVPTEFTTPSGLPVMTQLVAAFDGSSAEAHPLDGVTWRDRSGNENHASSYSANPNTRPTLRTNSLNGHNTLNFFRPSMQALRIEGTNSLGLGSNAYTWFTVSKPTNVAAGVFPSLIRHQSSTHGANWGSYFFPGNASTGNRPGLVSNGRNSSGGEVAAIAAPWLVGQWTLGIGSVGGSSPQVTTQLEAPASNAVVAVTNTGTSLTFGTPIATWIGTASTGISSAAFDGEMAEILIYSGELSAEQRAEVENYLRTKYFAQATISIRNDGGNLVIDFTGTLLSGDEPNGITNEVLGATSPYVVPTGADKQFFRTRLP